MSGEEIEKDVEQFCCSGEVGVWDEAEEREKQRCLLMSYVSAGYCLVIGLE